MTLKVRKYNDYQPSNAGCTHSPPATLQIYAALCMHICRKWRHFLAKTTKPQNQSVVGDRGLQKEEGKEYGICILVVFGFWFINIFSNNDFKKKKIKKVRK